MYAVEYAKESYAGAPRVTFQAFDAGTGFPLTLAEVHTTLVPAPVVTAAFSPDGQWLYSIASDGSLAGQWIAGKGHSSDWVADTTSALTGYRLIGDTLLEPLDSEELKAARDRALAKAQAAALLGDKAAQLALVTLESANSGRQ
jgi:hypothetical protein